MLNTPGPASFLRHSSWIVAGLSLACCGNAQSEVQGDLSSPSPHPTASQTSGDGRDVVEVLAGDYPIGRNSGPRSERPRHVVPIEAFAIDRLEVTNVQYAAYLNTLDLAVRGSFGIGDISSANGDAAAMRLLVTGDGRTTQPLIELDDDEARIVLDDGMFVPAAGHDDHPVTEVTWAGARAFCLWRGGNLPTEVQWEAAARGADDRLYPWGDEDPASDLAHMSGRAGETQPVGSLPAGASPFGMLDAAGSLSEWTLSLKRPYPYRPDDGREALDVRGQERATRGGDYTYNRRAPNLTVSFRDTYSNDPEHGHRHIGFRCAYR